MHSHSIFRPQGVILLVAALVLSACARTQYEQDYLPNTDFSPYSTYVWRSGETQIPGLELTRLQRLAQVALEKQGFRMDPEDPDLLISLHAFPRRETGGSRGVGLSIGVPLGSSGRLGVGGSRALPTAERQEGVLVMDVTERRANQLLWRGTASAIPMEHFRLAEEERLRQTVESLVRQFPPE